MEAEGNGFLDALYVYANKRCYCNSRGVKIIKAHNRKTMKEIDEASGVLMEPAASVGLKSSSHQTTGAD